MIKKTTTKLALTAAALTALVAIIKKDKAKKENTTT